MINSNCQQTTVHSRLPTILNYNLYFLRLVVKIHESFLISRDNKKAPNGAFNLLNGLNPLT